MDPHCQKCRIEKANIPVKTNSWREGIRLEVKKLYAEALVFKGDKTCSRHKEEDDT